MTKFPTRSLGLAVAFAAAALLAAPQTSAYPDAKVETQLRPDFGLLLKPPLRRKPRKPHRRYGPGHYRPDYGHGYRPWDGPLRDVAFVDCGQARGPNDINWALDSLAPGGTLIIRAGGAPCLDSVRINKPVTIQADGGRPWRGRRLGEARGDWTVLPATLKARAGQVCIDISPIATGEVILRNMVIEATEGGDQPCIYSEGANVRLESTVIRYAGDGPAVYVDGGSFHAYEDSIVDANTYDRAMYAEDAVVMLRDFTITGTPAIGLDITPSGSQDSVLEDVAFFTKPASPVFGTPSVGITVSPSRTLGRLRIEGADICGFGIGLWSAGSNLVLIDRSRICRAGKGVQAMGGEVRLENSIVAANVVGVQVGAAYPVTLNGNRFYGAREYNIFLEPGARRPLGANNEFYSNGAKDCSWRRMSRRHHRWREYERERRRRRRDELRVPPIHRWGLGRCMDPGGFDRNHFSYEQSYGYDDPNGFYGAQPWNREEVFEYEGAAEEPYYEAAPAGAEPAPAEAPPQDAPPPADPQ